ncbi:hypothetical protein BpHYR1_037563 [Brachionus plicatilis]|uniref:Uncharacterized protein n=1 Tax=Brachionus plicatilis TaxID=10195 RepID=A0A3M7RVJ5_BRAPC|nr:hypothetical protein BpHYR1_037563 [Brachionus plicatilis]
MMIDSMKKEIEIEEMRRKIEEDKNESDKYAKYIMDEKRSFYNSINANSGYNFIIFGPYGKIFFLLYIFRNNCY